MKLNAWVNFERGVCFFIFYFFIKSDLFLIFWMPRRDTCSVSINYFPFHFICRCRTFEKVSFQNISWKKQRKSQYGDFDWEVNMIYIQKHRALRMHRALRIMSTPTYLYIYIYILTTKRNLTRFIYEYFCSTTLRKSTESWISGSALW